MSESGEGPSGKAGNTSAGVVGSNAAGPNAERSSAPSSAPVGNSQNRSGGQSSGQLEVKLVSFNKFGDTGEHLAVYQPNNRSAGIRMIKGLKFSAAVQHISQSEWDEGLPPTDEASAEGKQLLERKK